jgi:hypothetical protein
MLAPSLFDPTPSDDTPIACDLSALDDPERHKTETESLFGDCEEIRVVSDGVALHFPGTMDYAERLLTFIGRERQCCPFLTFELIFEPENRGLWLVLGGNNAAAAYIQDQFDDHWT